MMRFFTRTYPKVIGRRPPKILYPGCFTIVNGEFVPQGLPTHYFAEKGDKHHHKKGSKAREEKKHTQMPGFVHPETMNEEGYFTQQAKQQIEEFKKKKDKPSLHNPEGKE